MAVEFEQEITDHGSVRLALAHLRERLDEGQARQDGELVKHDTRIAAVEKLVERLRGAWWAAGLAAAFAAAAGSFAATWFGRGGP